MLERTIIWARSLYMIHEVSLTKEQLPQLDCEVFEVKRHVDVGVTGDWVQRGVLTAWWCSPAWYHRRTEIPCQVVSRSTGTYYQPSHQEYYITTSHPLRIVGSEIDWAWTPLTRGGTLKWGPAKLETGRLNSLKGLVRGWSSCPESEKARAVMRVVTTSSLSGRISPPPPSPSQGWTV